MAQNTSAAYLPLPSPPEEWVQDNHYLVYGIPTSQERLLKLFASPTNAAASSTNARASQVVKLLRDVAGRGTEHVRVIPCRLNENAERPKKVLRYPGGDGVLVVALDWSYEPGWSKRGFTQEEMECLQEYFEGKTNWFKSCSTKDRWPIPEF